MIKNWYYNLSIARKLHILLMIGCLVGMTCFSFIYTYYGVHSLQGNMVKQTENVATLISSRLGTAIQFENADFVSKQLKILASDKSYEKICIHTSSGKQFATYPADAICGPTNVQWNGAFNEESLVSDDQISVTKNILVNGEVTGAITISRSTSALRDYLNVQMKIMVAVTSICLILCYFIASYLQRIISGPIREIAVSAQNIIGQESFNERLHPRYSDELGQLAEAFNRSLTVMNERYLALSSEHTCTSRAYVQAIDKLNYITEEFVEALDSFLVFTQMTNEEVMGKEVGNYIEYQKDVLDSLCFYQVKVESLKRLSNLYAQSITEPPLSVDVQKYLRNYAANLGQSLPFLSTDTKGELINKNRKVYFLAYKSAWDELFTLLKNMYSLLSGVVDFSAKITFDLPPDSSRLLMIFAEQNNENSKILPASVFEHRYELEETTYEKHSIEDPDAASEFIDEGLLQRQDMKYLLDSISYIANANEIALSHRFGPRRFVMEFDLSAKLIVSKTSDYLVVN